MICFANFCGAELLRVQEIYDNQRKNDKIPLLLSAHVIFVRSIKKWRVPCHCLVQCVGIGLFMYIM